jgi:hypothetical protein
MTARRMEGLWANRPHRIDARRVKMGDQRSQLELNPTALGQCVTASCNDLHPNFSPEAKEEGKVLPVCWMGISLCGFGTENHQQRDHKSGKGYNKGRLSKLQCRTAYCARCQIARRYVDYSNWEPRSCATWKPKEKCGMRQTDHGLDQRGREWATTVLSATGQKVIVELRRNDMWVKDPRLLSVHNHKNALGLADFHSAEESPWIYQLAVLLHWDP